jgi:hypothetical protein
MLLPSRLMLVILKGNFDIMQTVTGRFIYSELKNQISFFAPDMIFFDIALIIWIN